MSWHDRLWLLADAEIGAEPQTAHALAVAHRKFERRAGIVVPDLVGIDPVPVRALAGLQQEVDRRSGAAPFARCAEGLDLVSALGMGSHPEMGDDLVCIHDGGGTVAFIDGSLEKVANHLASFGRLARQSWLPKRKSR